MSELQGPPSYRNWVAAKQGQDSARAEEYPLFTDAYITGEIKEGCGPYQFLNTVPLQSRPDDVQPAVILRVEQHFTHDPENLPPMDATDVGYYHGGEQTDEIAALVSLALGIRCKAGGLTRCFYEQDHRGQPYAWESGRNPIFVRRTRAPVLPRVMGSHSLESLKTLQLFDGMSPPAATALIRAARLYQDGLWIAESEPSLSWLMLVSAVETAADYWRTEEAPPIERLKASTPKLFQLLTNTGIADLPEQVADEIAPSLGATKKFIDFIITFLPDAPSTRPPIGCQVPWDTSSMKKSLGKIYGYRSQALHGGMPFPVPMCDIPFRHAEWEAHAEKPIGSATYSQGGTWLAKDTPMLLHSFEYITRGSLLGWWRSLKE